VISRQPLRIKNFEKANKKGISLHIAEYKKIAKLFGQSI